ncbi:Cysteine-rich receptor-like protein kinase 10 [Zea mays]|uniref:Cysteine-rich receptor-like protein kinase 10 n=1 Tax=Zea mays TaxID=4577 RepID=A0A3L6FHR4_MAIZE|nr:Cysteine-rich receptor-like protein kinase 10 [Zea mays]
MASLRQHGQLHGGQHLPGQPQPARGKPSQESLFEHESPLRHGYRGCSAGPGVRSCTLPCGDINASACKDCVTTGFKDAQQLCVFNKEATVYYDSCLVSFSNEDFLSTTINGNENDVLVLMNTQNFTESADSIRLLLFTLLNDTSESAINSTRRFTTARMDISSLPTMYCAVQCTPDLTADECAACLQDFPQLTLQYLDGRRGGRLLGVRCNMRYEIYNFYQGDPMLRIISLASGVPTIGRKGKLWIIGIAIPLVAILLCSTFTFLWLMRRKKGVLSSQDRAGANRIEENALVWTIEQKSSEFTLFDLSELLEATKSFAEENRLGQGGFGPVYKGQLSDGQEIAVKRLASHSGQGFTEFRNEVELIAKLQHTNLTWHLWEIGRWLDLVEASISKEMHEAEARRYINIALMCVQENADDRPTMSDVVAALNSESVVLPEPKHPAYFNLRVSKSVESAVVVEACSLNEMTITQDPQGR